MAGGPASLISCGPILSVDPSPFLTALRLQVPWMGPQIPGSQEVLGVPWASLSPVSESHNIPRVLMQPELTHSPGEGSLFHPLLSVDKSGSQNVLDMKLRSASLADLRPSSDPWVPRFCPVSAPSV